MTALQSAASYKIDESTLTILDGSGATVLEFQVAEG
jgi:heat shock protein HslJ